MGLQELTAFKTAFDTRIISAMESPLTEATQLSNFMGEAITVLTVLEGRIEKLEEQMANRMLCKNYKEE